MNHTARWDDGYRVKVGMLRSLEWLEEAGITEVGDDVVEIDLEKMGVEGDFQVMAIDPCPEIEEGPGRLVISVYEFNRGDVHELKLSGIEQPIEVTPGHPFWSPDRGEGGWVAAGELQVGQRVLVQGGCAVVDANEMRNGGTIRSDDPTDPAPLLVRPISVDPQTFPKPSKSRDANKFLNEAQVDHINQYAVGGSNSYCNARVISQELNIRKRHGKA